MDNQITLELPVKDFIFDAISQRGIYLEFGCGESTLFAARSGADTIVSVDTDPAWVSRVSAQLKDYSVDSRIFLADVGPVAAMGKPVDNHRARDWPQYYLKPVQYLLSQKRTPSVILIDGRFRLACLAVSAAMFPEAPIVFDDYVNRSRYHVVEALLGKPDKAYGKAAIFTANRRHASDSRHELLMFALSHSADYR